MLGGFFCSVRLIEVKVSELKGWQYHRYVAPFP